MTAAVARERSARSGPPRLRRDLVLLGVGRRHRLGRHGRGRRPRPACLELPARRGHRASTRCSSRRAGLDLPAERAVEAMVRVAPDGLGRHAHRRRPLAAARVLRRPGTCRAGSSPTSSGSLLNAIRAFPEIVLAIAIFIPIAGLGAVAGALAIGVHSVGTLGKLTAEAIEGIDPGPGRGGARHRRARRSRCSAGACCRRCCRRWSRSGCTASRSTSAPAAVLGVVGAGGIGFAARSRPSRSGAIPQAGMAIIVVVVATIARRRRSRVACGGASSRAPRRAGPPRSRPTLSWPMPLAAVPAPRPAR